MDEPKLTGKWLVRFMNSETEREFGTEQEAVACAEKYVGNKMQVKPFKDEKTYLYGPGDGSTSVMVREDIEL